MRAGLSSIQQGLTAEATSTVKQGVTLARRRGHAQVTPLHVASAMLASSAGLLRRACLQSHSHPLQCKALELCFNVALNRLPASTPSPLLGPHYVNPSFSNALVAAFKRAQAHQRRGSIENQQQPILALKIELEQLIISILDDPSVSRVMREAGFSSTQVKNRVEQTVSLEICSQTQSHPKESTKPLVLGTNVSLSPPLSQFKVSLGRPIDQVRSEDVMSVLSKLSGKRKRNTVVVGECLDGAEGVVRGVIDKFDRGLVPGELRYVQFFSLPLFSFRNSSKEDVEQKLLEISCLVKSYNSRGVVLYLGDLKWISDFWSSYGEERRSYYCPVEHIIMELKRLVCEAGETGRLWLLGIATFQTYMRCKTGRPSLESIWELNPLAIPVGSLSLTLNLDSDLQAQFRSKESNNGSSGQLLQTGVEKHLTCCTDCLVNFRREASSFHDKETTTISTSSSLPSWLKQDKEESRKDSNDQECGTIRDLCNKWNSFCSSYHKQPHCPEKTLMLTSSSPSSPSISLYERNPKLHETHLSWPIPIQPKQTMKKQPFWMSEASDEGYESNLRMFMPAERNDPRPDLLSNPNSSPNSASSSEVMEDMNNLHMFRELNDENLKILSDALEKKVSWQKEIIPEISKTILQCRSGMSKRKGKEETWMFFLGADNDGKEKIARELAKIVFGSQRNLVSIGLSSFSSTRADSTEESKKKRARDELGCSYVERFGEAVNENPHRVFVMEDVEQIDYCSQKGIMQAIKTGRVSLPGSETVPLMDAIIIFSCESFSSVSRACSPPTRQKHAEEEKSPYVSLDLNISIEDEIGNEHSGGDIGILESVDKQVIFRIQEL